MDEKQLILALKKGGRAAYEKLFLHYKDMVLNTCLGFVPNQHDAEDICQEVFVKIFRTIEQFKGESKLSTWIYRIAVTESLQHIRNKKRKKRVAFFQSLIGMEGQTENIKADDYNHPGVSLENKERSQILFEHISRLPENQKVAFTLHKIEGMAYKEIAEIMEMSLSSIESLMFRAKKNLKKGLHDFYNKQMI